MAAIKTSLPRRRFDVVIVGAGGSGMRASLQLARAGLSVCVLSKVFPTRSHTVAAQGGIGASLGNMSEDNWHYHFYDTIKGSDWLGDQDAIEFMCREAPNAVYELEHMGMPFDRNADGTIYQRPFGGHTANYGEKPVQRACAAADRTGHALLHTLYQQNVAAKTQFFVEWMALDLIRDAEGDVLGVTALEMETGDVYILEGKTTLFATGGAGRIFAASTNAFINTGDGLGMAARSGIALQDMEFWQFHPTGVAGAGVLITEGVRGEGGILRNSDGERFMERYGHVAVMCGYYTLKLQARVMSGDYQAAIAARARAEPMLWSIVGLIHEAEYHFYGALACACYYDEASFDERPQLLTKLEAHQKRLEIWAETCPENFQNRHALVSAEIARIENRSLDAERLYEEAIRLGRERGLIRLDDPQRAAVQFFDSVGGDLHRRAMAGILPKNLRDTIQRSIDHAVLVFWNGIRVDGRP